MVQAFQIRGYRPDDREAVRDICFRTAFLGEPIDFLYRDKDSWVDIFTQYYTDSEPESAWVVTNADQRVVGYLLGCVDTQRATRLERIVLKHQLTRFVWARPGSAGFWWRLVADQLRDRGPHRPALDLARFPAHAHIDLLPEVRGAGMAAALFACFHERLRNLGVPGVHNEVLACNTRMLSMIGKLGYTALGAPFLVPGMRSPEGSRLYGQLNVCDLSGAQHTSAKESLVS